MGAPSPSSACSQSIRLGASGRAAPSCRLLDEIISIGSVEELDSSGTDHLGSRESDRQEHLAGDVEALAAEAGIADVDGLAMALVAIARLDEDQEAATEDFLASADWTDCASSCSSRAGK